MQDDFFAIAQAHWARYPHMQPQDMGKLAYQNQFGPAHLGPRPQSLFSALLSEWQALPPRTPPRPPEPIGNGLCRFHLTEQYAPDQAAPLLTQLLQRTAGEHRGSAAGLEQSLALLEGLAMPGLAAWLAAYRQRGCPAVHHSPAFGRVYQPHYRLLRSCYAGCFALLLRVQALARRGAPAVVAIDGRCGSGKTGLATLISSLFSCNVLHMDDFYLPPAQRAPQWEQQPGGNMDLERFLAQALLPACAGQPIFYRAYHCQSGTLQAAVPLPPRPLTVVEGSYSHHPRLQGHYDLQIFVTCSRKEQTRRLKAREGAHYPAFAERWIPLEERYIQACAPQADSLVVDTSTFF